MGHADVKTTEIYTHVMSRNIEAVVSLLDKLEGAHPLLDRDLSPAISTN